MNWKAWRLSLLVAFGTGVLTAFAMGQIIPNLTVKELIEILIMNGAKDVLLFMKDHPISSVSFDTTIITKDKTNDTTKP